MSNVVVASLVEFFTLKEAAKQAARLDEPGRKRVLERAGLAKQRADAAESLWAAGHPAEALRLLVDAFEKTREACDVWLDATGAAKPTPPPVLPTPTAASADAKDASADDKDASADEKDASADEKDASADDKDASADEKDASADEKDASADEKDASADEKDAKIDAAPKIDAQPAAATVSMAGASVIARFLRGGAAADSVVRRLEDLEKELAATTLPALDAEVLPAHGDLFDRLTDTRTAVARALADVTLVPRELTFRRIGRATTVVVLSLVAIVGSYLALRTPEGIHARASAHFNEMPDFEPSRVLDGNTETSWLLPDRTAGWVEVTINPARPVSRIRVLNTHNAPYNDRGTLQYRITVFAHGSEAQTLDGTFEFSAAPAWVTHDLGSVEGVDRVRFEVRTWHQHGGGLAEIAIE